MHLFSTNCLIQRCVSFLLELLRRNLSNFNITLHNFTSISIFSLSIKSGGSVLSSCKKLTILMYKVISFSIHCLFRNSLFVMFLNFINFLRILLVFLKYLMLSLISFECLTLFSCVVTILLGI